MLSEWRMWQLAQHLSDRTITERTQTIEHLTRFTGVTVDLIKPDHIIEFIARPNLSQASRASYHASIRAFYKWATQTERLTEDPTLATPSPKRKRALPRPVATEHINVLLNVANRRRTYAMIVLGAYAGLRVHEIAKFHGTDVDHIAETITVTGKGGSTALIPAHPRILTLAKEFPRRDYWFPAYETQSDKPHVDRQAVSRAIGFAMRRAGINATAHQLRHWYATTLLDNGVDVRVVKEMMRHQTLATTEIYTHVTMKKMHEGIVKLPDAA